MSLLAALLVGVVVVVVSMGVGAVASSGGVGDDVSMGVGAVATNGGVDDVAIGVGAVATSGGVDVMVVGESDAAAFFDVVDAGAAEVVEATSVASGAAEELPAGVDADDSDVEETPELSGTAAGVEGSDEAPMTAGPPAAASVATGVGTGAEA